MKKVLITCPPMLRAMDEFRPIFEAHGLEAVTPDVVQTMTEAELKDILPEMDAWIIGDDPATRAVFEAGYAGKLRAAVKWGVGVDNVDFEAAKSLGIPIINTPQMFGREVAGIAVNYLIGLARQTFYIDREVRKGNWIKPAGISLSERTVALIGYGDIGKATAQRLLAFEMNVNVYDPYATAPQGTQRLQLKAFPEGLADADFVVVTSALTPETRNMLNAETIASLKDGVRIVNVARGGIIDEQALIAALQSGKVHSAALDVFEEEPLPADSPLRDMELCIFGTHNSSNTIDAVRRASHDAIDKLFGFMGIQRQS